MSFVGKICFGRDPVLLRLRLLIGLPGFIFLISTSVLSQVTFLDPTFGSRGKAVVNFGEAVEHASASAIQADGKIIIAGEANTSSGPLAMVLARFNPNGQLDTSFNGNGKIKLIFGNTISAQTLTIQPDGKILAGGFSSSIFCLVRFNQDGSLDTTFDNDGIVVTDFGLGGSNWIVGVSVLQDGRVVAVGRVQGYIGLVRYNGNGSLDTTFGVGGKALRAVDGGSSTSRMIVQPDGKIIAVGWTNGTFAKFAVSRFNSDGTFDQSFGVGGTVVSDLNVSGARAWACDLQADGKIVVGGLANNDFFVVRLNPTGTFDTTWDGDGIVFTDFAGQQDEVLSVVVLPDGRIIAGGGSYITFATDFALARYLPDGSLDNTFGVGGKITTDFNRSFDRIKQILIQGDGKIIAAGQYTPDPAFGQDTDFAIVRYLTEGRSLNKCDFDGDGKTDLSIFRPGVGQWWYSRSSDGGTRSTQFGTATDKVVAADLTGDGKTDVAVFRPSTGTWFVLKSEDNTFYGAQFGANGDIPAPGDYDGDGKADTAVFRPSTGYWFIQQSTAGFSAVPFGANGDVPTLGDFDGDGKTDVAVFRPTTGVWYRLNSSNGSFFGAQFGQMGDKVVAADYTGDGKTDIAVWRPSSGTWYIQRSEDGSFYGQQFGLSDDLPTPGDYDGDGKADVAVFRPGSGTWFEQRSTSGFAAVQFGANGDKPAANAFVY